MEDLELYDLAESEDIDVKEYPLEGFLGLCMGNKILLKKGMTNAETRCVLAEELGHYFYTVGNIIDQSKIENIRQENTARRWAFKRLVPVSKIKKGIKEGHTEIYSLAEYLDVTEEFLKEAIEEYIRKNNPPG